MAKNGLLTSLAGSTDEVKADPGAGGRTGRIVTGASFALALLIFLALVVLVIALHKLDK